MTIIIFLVDTSASMNQRTYLGTSLLDVAKGAIETFMKIRSRDPNARWDRYMLLTFEEPPGNVKAGWKESHTVFISELKNMEANGLTNLGSALKHTFDLLNVNRMQTGIDTYGQGRCPFYLEPAVIIAITDGRKMTTMGGTQAELNLPLNNAVPGSELTKEPFRWDQRLFGLVLRMPAVPPPENMSTFIPSADDSPIDCMCEVTGGRSYMITTQRMLVSCLESLVQKCQSGVVINFEKIGQDPVPINDEERGDRSKTPSLQSVAWQNCRKMIFVPKSIGKGAPVGFWPIPESFWPDMSNTQLQPRNAQPQLKFTCTASEPMSLENLPFDKYELEPSPLTQYVLERRQPNVAWQVFIGNSAKYSELGHPCGYLKASTNLQAVNLFVMPYNYPVLIPLLDELIKVHKYKPTAKWRQNFDTYIKTMPIYYAQPLRRALSRMGVHNLVPDNLDNCLSYSVVAYLKKLKNQAKVEYEKMVTSVGQRAPGTVIDGVKVNARKTTSFVQRTDFNQLLDSCNGNLQCLKQEVTEYSTFKLHMPNKDVKPQLYRNPFDISRKNLVSQLKKMRANFTLPSRSMFKCDNDFVHNQPVSTMGNYQEYLKKQPNPLREVEASPARLHTFGNPFKVNKNLMIDEADEALPGQATGMPTSRKRANTESAPPGSPRPNKRKPGPLPKDVPARILMSPRPDHYADSPSPMPETPSDKLSDLSNTGLLNHTDNSFSNHIDIDSDSELEIVDENHISTNENEDYNHLSNQNQGNNPLTNKIEGFNNHMTILANGNDSDMKDYNMNLKKIVVKEVRKPGKNYEVLFKHLNTIQGTLDIKCLFLRHIHTEALRFKKRTLAQMLQQFENSMIKSETQKTKVDSNHKGRL